MVALFDPRAVTLTDDMILSFFRMMNAPDQRVWDYDEPVDADTVHPLSQAEVERTADLVGGFRANFLPNPHNYALWARDGTQIVGMVGVNRFEEAHRAHCAELGIGVAAAYQRQGIGYRLALGIIDRARREGIQRLEADCLVENVAVTRLLRKVGFVEEGMRSGAIRKQGALHDMRLFGLLL